MGGSPPHAGPSRRCRSRAPGPAARRAPVRAAGSPRRRDGPLLSAPRRAREPPSRGGTLHLGSRARQHGARPAVATGAAAVGNSSARERAPRAGVDPAHVGGQRADVVLGEEAAEGRHLDRLATEEERADRVLGDSPDLALRDPVPELLVAAHEVVEVRTPVARHVALERARVGYATSAERTVAGEAAELRGEIRAAGGEGLLG